MKIIAVNGSPRSGWNTDILVREATAGAASAGAEVEFVDLYKLDKFTGCVSCFGCKTEGHQGKCIYKDGLADVLEKMRNADGIILGSPVYLGTFYSDELVPYTGQTVYNFQYNFCLPVKSEPLQKLLRDGLDNAATFDKFYQLLHDLGGHVLFWV